MEMQEKEAFYPTCRVNGCLDVPVKAKVIQDRNITMGPSWADLLLKSTSSKLKWGDKIFNEKLGN
jgi:hypothetical protein